VFSPALRTAASTAQAGASQPRAQAKPEAAISKDEFVPGSAKSGPVISAAEMVNNPISQSSETQVVNNPIYEGGGKEGQNPLNP
jgi:hypothetical protein